MTAKAGGDAPNTRMGDSMPCSRNRIASSGVATASMLAPASNATFDTSKSPWP